MKSVVILLAVAIFSQGAICQSDPDDKGIGSGEAPASDQPSSGEQFVAFHRDVTVGAKEELSPTLLGVNNMAMKFLPGNLRLLTVISVHREIVAGVKYELLVNAMQENNERTVCHLVILEKPWIVNQWGEKWRNLLQSNCTVEGVGVEQPPNAPPGTFHVNPVFNSQQPASLTEDRIRELEQQILRSNSRRVENPVPNHQSPVTEQPAGVPLEPLPASPVTNGGGGDKYDPELGLSTGVREELDKFFQTQQLATRQHANANEAGVVVPVVSTSESSPISIPDNDEQVQSNLIPQPVVDDAKEKQTEVTAVVNININNQEDDQDNVQQVVIPVFQNAPLAPMNENDNPQQQQLQSSRRRRRSEDLKFKSGFVEIARNLGGDLDEEAGLDCADKPFQFKKSGCPVSPRVRRSKPGGLTDNTDDPKVKDIVKVALAKLAGSSDKAEKLQLVSIEKSRVQVVAGQLYHIDVLLKDGEEGEPKKCTLKVWYQRWKSEDPIEVNGECEDQQTYTHKRVERSPHKDSIVGGATKVENPENDLEIQGYLNDALTAYNAGKYGNGHSVNKILSATVQIVAGTLHKIDVELTNEEETKVCHVEVWNRRWLENGKEITVSCEGEDEVKSRSRRSLIFDHRRPLPDAVRSLRDGQEARDKEELHQNLFIKFQTKFARDYGTEREKTMRYKVFQSNIETIEQLNRHELGTAKYGLTEFADMTAAEFKRYTGLLNAHHNPRLQANHLGNPMAEIPDIEVPQSFDWRDKNVISPVKNQGQCGSCWAFSVIGNIEGLNAIKTGKLEEFSEQELVDCDTMDSGCNGGLPDNAYKAIEQIGGLEYESEYPYEAKQKQCHFNRTLSHVRVKGAVDLPKDEKQMAQWLVANGPISIGLNAAAMQFYHGGVSHPYRFVCRASKIDHGVLIVGLGQSDYPTMNKTLPYWIVKNSWGPTWGERGYYRIYRGDNTCGINSMASSAVLE